MSHLRITAAGWQEFTGHFGSTEFKNGVSVEKLTRNAIDHVSALVQCHLSDAEGTVEGVAGIAARMVGSEHTPSEMFTGLRLATKDELDAERRRFRENSGKAPTPIYTQDELEQLAAKEGMKGLRAIGDKWSVRDRAIPKLIAAVLRAQAAFLARTEELKIETDKKRAEAAQEALKNQAEKQAAFDARARVMTTTVESETSNAIGANGENIFVPTKTTAEVIEALAKEAATAAPVDAPVAGSTVVIDLTTPPATTETIAQTEPPAETPPQEVPQE